jgi:hypothetical protein
MKFLLLRFALALAVTTNAFANVVIEEELYVVSSDISLSKNLQKWLVTYDTCIMVCIVHKHKC